MINTICYFDIQLAMKSYFENDLSMISELTQQTFDELRLVLPVNKNEIDGNSSQNDCNADSYRNK